ncbi:MAG: hypothetical protein IT315_07375 [Anaerolineales bacterium]|nr:hypothetical protein [Anaerolineales bacterium]
MISPKRSKLIKSVKYAVMCLAVLIGFLILPLQATDRTKALQAATPTLPATASTMESNQSLDELERRVKLLESEQERQIKTLQESNNQYEFLLNSLVGFLAFIITAGGILQFLQFRREGKRDETQMARERDQDNIQDRSAQQVSSIMDVVRNTLQSRLDAEIQAREEASKAREDLNAVRKEVEAAGIFFKNFQTTIQSARNVIEENAVRLAQTPRHEFRPISSSLASFAQQFDNFNTEYKQLEVNPPPFTSKALYIRGIAAHYSNQPKLVKQYLLQVTESKAEHDDTEKSYKRRLANAYYYLGVTDSNFGNIQTAIDYLEQGNNLDPDGTDFLTRAVTAEAYVMSSFDEFAKAEKIIAQVEDDLNKKKERDGRLGGVYLRLQSRAALIRVNMTILKHEADWQKVAEKLLINVRKDDPSYYYATYTLAQIYSTQGQVEEARKLFCDAYETLERSNDLITTTEVRSLVLMRMVVGLCARHGLQDQNKSDEYLDKADSLRNLLPRIDSQVCTVFSVLSKFNERSETIHDHVEAIRSGEILLERRRRSNNI